MSAIMAGSWLCQAASPLQLMHGLLVRRQHVRTGVRAKQLHALYRCTVQLLGMPVLPAHPTSDSRHVCAGTQLQQQLHDPQVVVGRCQVQRCGTSVGDCMDAGPPPQQQPAGIHTPVERSPVQRGPALLVVAVDGRASVKQHLQHLQAGSQEAHAQMMCTKECMRRHMHPETTVS